jgi:hypothetical protein
MRLRLLVATGGLHLMPEPVSFWQRMHGFRRRHYRWLRHMPRRKHLKGGRLHRLLGDGLFGADLWKPSRRTIAGGLALGIFIGLTPTMGAQIILAGIAAYFLKVNIPVALAGTLVTNPFTAAIIYPLLYRFGVWMVGIPDANELEGYTGMLRSFAGYAKPLWVASLVAGSVAAAFAYALVTLLWPHATHTGERDEKPRRSRDDQTSAS